MPTNLMRTIKDTNAMTTSKCTVNNNPNNLILFNHKIVMLVANSKIICSSQLLYTTQIFTRKEVSCVLQVLKVYAFSIIST